MAETTTRLPEAPYAFRPAKRIQRLMFCDMLRCLRGVRPMHDYLYVGLGHWQFVDFEYMRREVGVVNMLSIERNTSDKPRFEYNLPFEEVRLEFGEAYDHLQQLEPDVPTIVWLDYTTNLRSSVLRDLRLLAARLPAGSVIAATVNSHPGREDQRLPTLRSLVGEDIVPGDITEDDLDRDGLPKVQQRILMEQVGDAAATRPDPMELRQSMLICYSDRSPMLFWASLLDDGSAEISLAHETMGRLEQFRDGVDPLEITVPVLSTREVTRLNELMSKGEDARLNGLTADDCDAYAGLRRWYPSLPLPF